MTSWREEYSNSLRDRDEREKASYSPLDDDLIAAFTSLLARTTALEAEKAASTPLPKPTPEPRKSPSPSTSKDTPPDPSDSTAQLRSDLAEVLRANTTLQTRAKTAEAEVLKLRAATKIDKHLLEVRNRERGVLAQKTKDRDEELRGKAKFLDDAQDEIISLNLQLNMSEKKVKKVEADNRDLIDRWMTHKAQQAEDMNKTLQ